jgi:predicted DNA-binding transcriptional regulator YafY
MSGYSELIKNFDKLRDYMRDFFIYGYKTRSGYTARSSRTYDNERRRLENYLSDYIRWDYGKKGKRVSVSLDTAKLAANPFYAVYRCKSFTDNDLQLHFYLLALLQGRTLTLKELADELAAQYDALFELQTLRAKVKEYTADGILVASQRGRAAAYTLSSARVQDYLPPAAGSFLNFFSEYAPAGVIGTYLADRLPSEAACFFFKHHFITRTLEDNILLVVLQALHQGRWLQFSNFSQRRHELRDFSGLPLKVLTSSINGRQYVLIRSYGEKKYASFRLDYIKSARLGPICPQADAWQAKLKTAASQAWGTTYRVKGCHDTVTLTLEADEIREPYILRRLERERRNGKVQQAGPNLFQYTTTTSSASEMLGWVKTFTGRIVKLEANNQEAVWRLTNDLDRMHKLYGLETEETSEQLPTDRTAADEQTTTTGPTVGTDAPDTEMPDEQTTNYPAETLMAREDHLGSPQVPASFKSIPASALAACPRLNLKPAYELFSEIYGSYYQLMAGLLRQKKLTREQVCRFVSGHGLSESTLEFLPKFLDGRSWPLFTCQGQTYTSKLPEVPELPLTKLEAAWLKAVLQDPRAGLFMSDAERAVFQDKLTGTEPLYRDEDLLYFDRYLDGDDYQSPVYRQHFSQLLTALQQHQLLHLSFTSGKGRLQAGDYLPLKLEYSDKNDKFRCYCLQIRRGRSCKKVLINLSRLQSLTPSRETFRRPVDEERYFSGVLVSDPLVVRVTKERNALERFMVEFSTYQKTAVFDEDSGTCIVQIYYPKDDETEVLIKVLGYGPVVKVLNPPRFVELIRQRLHRQEHLTKESKF